MDQYAPGPGLAPDATVIGVLVCRQSDLATVVELRADADFEDVVAALRMLPDEPVGGFCMGEALIIPPVGVVTSDGVVWPHYPQDDCHGFPPALQHAVDSLVPTSTRQLSLGPEAEESQASIDARTKAARKAGCPDLFKNLVELGSGGVLASQPPALPSGELTVCVMQGGDAVSPMSFLRGGSVAGEVLEKGIADRGPVPSACSTSTEREVALITERNLLLMVELDGCRRIWVGSGFLGTAGDDLIAALQSKG